MSTTDITEFYVHTVTVETFNGPGAQGPVYAAGVAITGFLDSKLRLLRGLDGSEVISTSNFFCSLADSAHFTPDSRVTIPGGRTTQVITINSMDAAGLLAGVEHAQIFLK